MVYYESYKMNNLNFGRCIEDILTRMKDGDKDYRIKLPCIYVEKTSEILTTQYIGTCKSAYTKGYALN